MVIWKAFYKHLGKCQVAWEMTSCSRQKVCWGRKTQEMYWYKENCKNTFFFPLRNKGEKILLEQTSQQFDTLFRWKIQLLYIYTNKMFLPLRKLSEFEGVIELYMVY